MEHTRNSETETFESGISDWFLTYGDLMSILLCFFIMLYAMSTLQVPKMQAAVESFRGGSGMSGMLASRDQNQPPQTQGQKQIQPEQYSRLQTTTSNENSLKNGVIPFNPNSDELNDNTKRHLNTLLEELAASPCKIQITGHAEPNEQGSFRDSMDLSYSRAVNVQRYFVSKGMNQNDFRVYAAGSSEPVGSEENGSRLTNMCVDIKIIADAPRTGTKKNAAHELNYLRF